MTSSDYREVDVRQARDLAEAGSILLDVREDDEWAEVHAPGALHIPMSQLNERAAEIPRDTTIVCICHLGGRSAMVTEALNARGWTAVNVAGGMQAWQAAGLDVLTG